MIRTRSYRSWNIIITVVCDEHFVEVPCDHHTGADDHHEDDKDGDLRDVTGDKDGDLHDNPADEDDNDEKEEFSQLKHNHHRCLADVMNTSERYLVIIILMLLIIMKMM